MAKHLFQPGNPGRPKGAKNKFHLTTVKEFFQKTEIDLIAEIWATMRGLPREVQLSAQLRLLQWVDPRGLKIENGDQRTGYPFALPKGDEGIVLDVLKPDEKTSNG